MSKVKYTKEQQKVIDYRGGNLLVSAAAGSGKTAVLVERIVQRIVCREISIDEVLVVTFTNASAMEMKERIGRALYDIYEKSGDDYIKSQLFNISTADISTMHSFCKKIISNYFFKTDLDPRAKIADEQSLQLLRYEVMENLLEDCYEKNEEDFLLLSNTFEGIGSESKIRDMVFQLYYKSMSRGKPIKWLDEIVANNTFETEEDYLGSEVLNFLFDNIRGKLIYLNKKIDSLLKNYKDHEMLKKSIEQIYDYKDIIDSLLSKFGDKKELIMTARRVTLDNLKAVKGNDPDIIKYKETRKEIKATLKSDILEKLTSMYFEHILEGLRYSKKFLETLTNLTKEFINRYSDEKKKNTMLDFNDLEHIAIKILYENGEISEVAKEIRNNYKEILIDEYQDTNYVQEMIVAAVSKESIGEPNVFMVGDLKQSIYKFRNAVPKIFASKYSQYSYENSKYTKVDLNKNFRSRESILNFINHIFKNIMSEKVGDINYDKNAYLYKGASFSKREENVEIIICEKDKTNSNLSIQEEIVANKIKELVHNENYIDDKKTGERKRIRYSDIAILLRSDSGAIQELSNVFKKHNIPLVRKSKTGYFDSLEIIILLAGLDIIDNPNQDEQIICVMKSAMFNFSDDELVEIRTINRDLTFFDATKEYALLGEDEITLTKVNGFLQQLDEWILASKELTVYELLNKIIEDTDYMSKMSLSTGSKSTINNINLLLAQAFEYEETSYKGLFNFARFIRTMKNKKLDFGVANDVQTDNFVSVLTVHGSKGLEFPVVFLMNTQKTFNKRDAVGNMLVHDELGVGMSLYYPEQKLIVDSPINEVLKDAIKLDSVSEEMRLLYVAMTRARERLYITASVNNWGDIDKKLLKYGQEDTDVIAPFNVEKSNSFLDFIIAGTTNSHFFEKNFDVKDYYKSDGPLCSKLTLIEDVAIEETQEVSQEEDFLSESDKEKIEENIRFKYPFEKATKTTLRTTVSEIKKRYSEEEDFNFMPGDRNNTGGAKLGTAYHLVMEKIPFDKVDSRNYVKDFIKDLLEKDILSEEEMTLIDHESIFSFFESEVGKRAILAYNKGELYKEKSFILGLEAEDNDMTMVQGMIDLYFVEDDQIVLIDYKTDNVSSENKNVFTDRYKVQLALYKKAVAAFTGLPVKEVFIYSSTLREFIEIK